MDYLIYLNIVYFLFAFFLIYPPNEVISLGFSIPTLFSSALGSEQMHFVHYHMIRVLITISIHSLLPLGYYLFLGVFAENSNLLDVASVSPFWKAYLSSSVLLAIGILTLVYYWKIDNFYNHPIAVKLRNTSRDQNSNNQAEWYTIASRVNSEFRRVEKFTAGSIYNQIFVTDSYLIKVGLYTIHVCLLTEVDLILTHTNEFKLTQEGGLGTQYLNIQVKPREAHRDIKPFSFRLNSFEYKDFNDKLQRPVIEACDIIIKQSLPEQFLGAFRDQINENDSYETKVEDVDVCVGCMRKNADVKLRKSCGDSSDCRECYCKPMWCLECMGKWFAYRQDQTQPGTWLSSKATCATCRAKFCILDVCPVNIVD